MDSHSMYLDQLRIAGSFGISGPVSITGTVDTRVVDPITGTVGITGPVDVNVLNSVSIANTVDISGNVGIIGLVDTIVSNIVGVTGIVAITGPVDISGNVGITGPVDVNVLNSVSIANTVDISGNVGIDGIVDISGNVGISGIVDVNVLNSVSIENTVDISGNVGIIGLVDTIVSNIVGVTGTVAITGPVDVSGNVVVTGTVAVTGPVSVVGAVDVTSASNSDAFGRLRVSNPYTLFEFNSIFGKQPYLIDEYISGSATSDENSDSYIEMTVSADGAQVVRQSHEYIQYQPGKSKLVYMTGVLCMTDAPGCISRIGCFDDTIGGVYIQQEDGDISVVIQHTNTAVGVPRTSADPTVTKWTDPLDGTGLSGINIDFTKAQIFWFDFEWLGVGQVRCGIVYEGRHITYYTFTHANALLAPYIPTAKLPIRFDIAGNSSYIGTPHTMRMICGTVISEGGYSPAGRLFSYPFPTGVPLSSTNTPVAVLAMRLQPVFPKNSTTIKIKSINIFNTDNNAGGRWALIMQPGYGSSPSIWASPTTISESVVQIIQPVISPASPLPIPSSTRVLYSGFFNTREAATFVTSTDELIAAPAITTNLSMPSPTSADSDVVILVCSQLYGTPTVYANINWIEIT